jgi:hypothetical protein
MKKFAVPFLLLSAILFCSPVAFADDTRAQEILKDAHAAIGSEEALQKIQSLVIKGQYRRILGERELGGDREISIALPDKYLIEDAMNPGGMSTAVIMSRGLNGEQAWTGTSGGGGGMFIRMGATGGQQLTTEQMEKIMRRQLQIEFTRYLLAILSMPPPSFAVTYKYAGESEVEDIKADAIDVEGPDGFAIRLFFDKQTHVPLLLSYRGPKPRMIFNTAVDRSKKPEEAAKKAMDDAQKKIAAEPTEKPELVDFFIRLSDYKKEGGLLLPHKLTFLTETSVSEEFTVSKYQLNPQLKPDKFKKS